MEPGTVDIHSGAIGSMSLIIIDSKEITVGAPLPWPLYGQERNMLAEQGCVVRDNAHRDMLLSGGAYRELSWKVPGDEDGEGDSFEVEEAPAGQSADDKTGKSYTFDDIKLKAEDRLQLEPPAQLARERFLVKVLGYLRGNSLLVTAPITANGLRLQLMENEKVVMRSFSGQNAFGFACTIKRVCKIPYEYLHLSFPDKIQGIMIRKAPRVKSRIIAAVRGDKLNAGEQVSALISNISANGASLDAKRSLGGKGDALNLEFRVRLHNIDAYLSVKGVVRAVISGNDTDAPADIVRHGIEFHELQPNDSVVLQSMIYQQMIENPHNLM